MKRNLRNLMNQLSQAADALRFADAGEMLPLDDKTSLLGVARPAPRPAPPRTPAPSKRRIALVAERQFAPGALEYALNVCERLEADLEVLAGPELKGAEKAVESARKGRPLHWHLERLGEDFLSDVASYAWTSHGLLFVVTAAGDRLAERVADRDGGRLGVPSQVPWVVVTGERNAA